MPEANQPEPKKSALEVNTVDATEGQKLQADQTINQDPTIEAPDVEPEPGQYDGLKLDELRAKLKERELPTSGNKDELVARLVEDDGKSADEPADQTVNGGIRLDRAFSDAHAATLQSLSDARRAAQLKAVSG